jgi:hypothetical protein
MGYSRTVSRSRRYPIDYVAVARFARRTRTGKRSHWISYVQQGWEVPEELDKAEKALITKPVNRVQTAHYNAQGEGEFSKILQGGDSMEGNPNEQPGFTIHSRGKT